MVNSSTQTWKPGCEDANANILAGSWIQTKLGTEGDHTKVVADINDVLTNRRTNHESYRPRRARGHALYRNLHKSVAGSISEPLWRTAWYTTPIRKQDNQTNSSSVGADTGVGQDTCIKDGLQEPSDREINVCISQGAHALAVASSNDDVAAGRSPIHATLSANKIIWEPYSSERSSNSTPRDLAGEASRALQVQAQESSRRAGAKAAKFLSLHGHEAQWSEPDVVKLRIDPLTRSWPPARPPVSTDVLMSPRSNVALPTLGMRGVGANVGGEGLGGSPNTKPDISPDTMLQITSIRTPRLVPLKKTQADCSRVQLNTHSNDTAALIAPSSPGAHTVVQPIDVQGAHIAVQLLGGLALPSSKLTELTMTPPRGAMPFTIRILSRELFTPSAIHDVQVRIEAQPTHQRRIAADKYKIELLVMLVPNVHVQVRTRPLGETWCGWSKRVAAKRVTEEGDTPESAAGAQQDLVAYIDFGRVVSLDNNTSVSPREARNIQGVVAASSPRAAASPGSHTTSYHSQTSSPRLYTISPLSHAVSPHFHPISPRSDGSGSSRSMHGRVLRDGVNQQQHIHVASDMWLDDKTLRLLKGKMTSDFGDEAHDIQPRQDAQDVDDMQKTHMQPSIQSPRSKQRYAADSLVHPSNDQRHTDEVVSVNVSSKGGRSPGALSRSTSWSQLALPRVEAVTLKV